MRPRRLVAPGCGTGWDRLGVEDGIGWRVGRGDNRLRREARVGGDWKRGSGRAWSLVRGGARVRKGASGAVRWAWCGTRPRERGRWAVRANSTHARMCARRASLGASAPVSTRRRPRSIQRTMNR